MFVSSGLAGLALTVFLVLLPGCGGGSSTTDGGTDTSDGWTGGDIHVDPGSCGFENVPFSEYGELLQLATQDDTTCVKLKRKQKSSGGPGGITTPYDPGSMVIGHDGASVVFADPADLTYTITLHNWYDSCEGTRDGTRYLFEVKFDVGGSSTYQYFITAFSSPGGQTVWGPVEVLPVGKP
jgi:hypothetical protein